MAGRPGFLGGPRQGGDSDWGPDGLGELGSVDAGTFRFAQAPRTEPYGMPPGFDPVWGTLGGPVAQTADPWSGGGADEGLEGPAAEVEIYGTGFQITGQVRMGHFDRLSDWMNAQSGFVRVLDASHVYLGHDQTPESERDIGVLWIRVDQITLVAERARPQQQRPPAMVVQKVRHKVSIVAPGYNLRGSVHVHAASSMKQFLEMAEPRFMPLTDVTVRWLDNPRLAARFPFAVVNREQLITVLDEPTSPTGEAGRSEADQERERELARRTWGAA
jgi:hypothetical protein